MQLNLKSVLMALALAMLAPLYTIGLSSYAREYTKEHPLVYEDAWDLWPYVYLNEHGQPEGFNIDLLKALFHDLDIPYVIKLKPTSEAVEDLRTGRSDLMLRLVGTFHDDYAHYGREVVQLFTHSVVSPKSMHLRQTSFKDLAGRQLIVHGGSLSHRMLLDGGYEDNTLPYDDMKEAIQKVSSDEDGIILWNTMSLKWLLNKYQIKNLQLTPIDITHGEYKFMSNDTTLLKRLDAAYARLCSTERIQPIQNKWFYPERVDSGIPQWATYVVAIGALLACLFLYFVLMLHLRERRIMKIAAKHNRRLALILHTTKIRVWLYNVHDHSVQWMTDDGKIESRRHQLSEYASDYTADTFGEMESSLAQIADGRRDSSVQQLVGEGVNDGREYVLTLSVYRRSKRGEPEVIVGMMDDQTERLLSQRAIEDRMLQYQSIFSTSMVDMTYYDQKGILTNINQKACQTFHCSREEILAEGVPFNFAMEDPDLTVDNFEGAYTTHIIKAKNNDNLANSIRFPHNVYYEQQLTPVYDASHQLLGIFGSGRDVSEFVNSYHQLKRSVAQLTSAAQDITEYINNINYALHVGGVRLVDYSPQSHMLTIYREMNTVQLSLTQSRCLSLVDERSKRIATRVLNAMDLYAEDTFDEDIKTIIRIPGQKKLSLQFHLFPVYSKAGKVEHYFGLCRDISQEKATEEELEREKAKAQEVENVKNAFLRNMSHEIRTPITTVVGFAELFVGDHDPEDEDGFIDEIKSNASFLLKLVNDILFLSRLDARMIEFNRQPIDFAYTFEGHCQMGWAKSQLPGVKYIIENPYEHLVLNIDDSNIGHIIEQVAENAARYTDSGMVKARYDYIGDRLLITIADSGRGIDIQQQKRLFERFSSPGNNGTGLGLPICRELAHQMGGDVYLNSAPGKGTTVWILIPCEAIQIEKKQLSN